jgi:valine--pyruvate aminotransferase
MNYSDFGERFRRRSGITLLMEDLAEGLAQDDVIMLGGGNPAAIPEALAIFQQTLDRLNVDGRLLQALANYDGPQGRQGFLESLAEYFNQRYGWGISWRNITLTHGSQSAFFALFNSFAGRRRGGKRHVLLPITPEYIGYADIGIEDDLFISREPEIERLDDGFFKYHIDFDRLEIGSQTGLICVSRPTNPSGNVLTDEECEQLDRLARSHDLPLLIDNAYGTPFPHIIFNEVTPFWNDNTILCMSLSKLGLPGVRTGIVIANEEVITQMANMTAITSLSPGGVGPVLVDEMISAGDLTRLSDEIIRPFYQQRCRRTIKRLREAIDDPRLWIHLPDGAIFLWLWFEGLSISSLELYRELKREGLLVIPGEYFFPGQDVQPGDHASRCIRMNYVRDEEEIERGVEILARVLRRYW